MPKIVLFADYHTHTTYSDGKCCIEEVVEAAIKKGLKEIAITDHGLGHMAYGLKKECVKEAKEEIGNLNKKYKDVIKVIFGIEANIVSLGGDTDLYDEYKQYFDLVLLGFHYITRFKSGSRRHFVFQPRKHSKEFIDKTTKAFISAINKNKIDILSHPNVPLLVNHVELASACREVGTSIEINCKHHTLSDVEMFKEMKETGCNFAINTDAHKAFEVGNFENGIEIAGSAGITADRIINAVKH